MAGGLKFRLGYHSGGGIHIGIGYRKNRRHRHHRHHSYYCNRDWHRGHYDTVRTRVWTPAHHDRIWEDARYEKRHDSRGNHYTVLVRRAGYRTVHVAGHYDYRTRRVYTPGRWVYHCNTPGHHH